MTTPLEQTLIILTKGISVCNMIKFCPIVLRRFLKSLLTENIFQIFSIFKVLPKCSDPNNKL